MRSIVCILAWSTLASAEPPSTAAVTGIAVVAGSTCALHADGGVSCWGRELERTRKDPAIHARPIAVTAFRDGVVQLEGVFGGICARYRDGTVKCLGMVRSSTGVPELQPLSDIADLRGTCARNNNGHVSCFDGKAWSRVANLDDAIDVHGHDRSGCAIHKDATVSCWSAESNPELLGAAADGSAKLVPGVKDAVQVRAGQSFACARIRDGHVTCWGDNGAGELGRGATDDSGFHAAARVAGVSDAVDLMAGAVHACIRRKAGAMACWGQLPWNDKKVPRVAEVKPLAHITAFAGGDQQCAVGSGRDIWCLGAARDGELGNGLSAIQEVALEIPGVHDAIQIYATTLGTCALHRTGAVTCWGSHDDVKLPAIKHLSQSSRTFSGEYLTGLDAQGRLWINGEATPRKLPKGTTHAGPCVIANGEVWCNANVPGATHNPVVGRLDGVNDAVEIVGSQHLVLRHRAGTLATFTVDTALSESAPTPLPTIDDAIAIAAGSRIACAVRADHRIWCWGAAESTLLGRPGAAGTQLPPARIVGITDVASVAISDEMPTESIGFMCAVKLDGSVACWGENGHGQLGTTTKVASTTPLVIRGVKDAIQVSAGWLHACALTKSGTVACWGSTEEGAGGTPTTSRIDHPVAVAWP